MSTHIIGFARLQLGHLMEAVSPVATVADLGSRPLNLIMPHSGIRVRVTGYRGTLVGGPPHDLSSCLRPPPLRLLCECMPDIGLTHIALPCTDLDASISFYETFASMKVVHRRVDETERLGVVWLTDHTRPFVLVLLERKKVEHALRPDAHLGVGCASREEVDRLCRVADEQGRLLIGPKDSGPPVGNGP